MVFYETIIHAGYSENNTETLSDFDIVSYKSNHMICKINKNNKYHYFTYYPKTSKELYILSEVNNNSPLWIVTSHISYGYGNQISVKLKIDFEKSIIGDYINSCLSVNSIITENFEMLPNFTKTDFSTKSIVPFDEPHEVKSDFLICLYQYQKRSLSKMIKMEKGNVKFKVKYTLPVNLFDDEFLYDPISNKRVQEDKYLNLTIRGGVLADEMGLGKTITSIALIYSNPAPPEHPAVKYSQSYEMNKLFAKATLILCPSHLVDQWESEILKCTKKFKVLKIVSKRDMDKLKVTDIQTADIIITSHQFLMKFDYYPRLHYNKHITPSTYDSVDRKKVLRVVLQDLMNDEALILALTTPIFEFFFFQRIIMDEGHEIFGEMSKGVSIAVSKYITEWVSSMDANYYWYISGTPFVNFSGVKNCSKFIGLKLVEESRQLAFDYDSKNNIGGMFNFLNKEYIWNNILEKICIRHRKLNVENEIKIPGFDEKIIWVKFTELEKQLYKNKEGKVTDSYLQQLCCHPMVIDSNKKIYGNAEVDLSLMQDKLIEYHKKTAEDAKAKIEKLDPKNQAYHMLKKNFEGTMNESNYLYKILSQMKNKEIDEEEKCAICLDPIDNPTLTSCGHLFCYDCLTLCLSVKKLCPMCKTDLTGKEILTAFKKPSIANDTTNPLIQKYGSKLGKTISIIRKLVTLPESRIIVFSQWDDMLTLIGKTLSENGVSNCFVKGNVWARNKAIKKFKTGINNEGDDNKVIMLSLQNAASGTNLTEASHILFIEPINSTVEERKAIEGQAIGRACRVGQKNKVTVMRILIEDTIEEKIYRSTYNKDIVIDFKDDDAIMKEINPEKNKDKPVKNIVV